MLNYNVEVSLVGTLARKIVAAVETLTRSWNIYHYSCLSCCCAVASSRNYWTILINSKLMMSLLFYKDIILMLRERRIRQNWIFNLCRTNGFASAVDWLKIYNLPGKPDIQISQMFPADALVSSPRAEKSKIVFCYWTAFRAISQNYGWHCFLQRYMLVTMLIQVIVAKLLYQFIFLYLLYMKKISIRNKNKWH